MQKFTVICGPEMTREQGLDVYRKNITKIPRSAGLECFPEGIMGANAIKQMVFDYAQSDYSIVFLTRYEHILNSIGLMIYDEKLKPDQVKIFLVREDGVVTQHYFDEEGVWHLTGPSAS